MDRSSSLSKPSELSPPSTRGRKVSSAEVFCSAFSTSRAYISADVCGCAARGLGESDPFADERKSSARRRTHAAKLRLIRDASGDATCVSGPEQTLYSNVAPASADAAGGPLILPTEATTNIRSGR